MGQSCSALPCDSCEVAYIEDDGQDVSLQDKSDAIWLNLLDQCHLGDNQGTFRVMSDMLRDYERHPRNLDVTSRTGDRTALHLAVSCLFLTYPHHSCLAFTNAFFAVPSDTGGIGWGLLFSGRDCAAY